jgi:hypothetical protein
MSNSITYPRDDLADKRFYGNLIVEYNDIPVAAFLSPVDCRMFLESIPEYMRQTCLVYSNQIDRDCRGKGIMASTFIREAREVT